MAFSPHSSVATSHTSGINGAAYVFQPPQSPPAAYSASPSYTTAADYFSHASRKRQRPDSAHAHDAKLAQQTPWTATPSWAQASTPGDGIFGSAYGHQSGMVNERYRLADGYDTPSIEASAQTGTWTSNADAFRRRLRGEDVEDAQYRDHAPLFGPLARERNGIARLPSYSNGPGPSTWTGLAVGLVGKVLGMGGNVIRGFYAGGGKGYDMKTCALVGSDLLQESTPSRSSGPVPMSRAEAAEFDGDFEQDNPSHSTGRPPNKRRQTDRDTWVMVGTPDLNGPASPRHKSSATTVPTRSSFAARPSPTRNPSRRSLAPVSRRQSSYVGANGSPAQAPPVQPVQQVTQVLHTTHRRTSVASVASARSPQGRVNDGSSSAGAISYPTPEAERLAKRAAKQERQNNLAMNSLSRQMEQMIRQAKAALGTQVSVEGEGEAEEDEGFVDDEW